MGAATLILIFERLGAGGNPASAIPDAIYRLPLRNRVYQLPSRDLVYHLPLRRRTFYLPQRPM